MQAHYREKQNWSGLAIRLLLEMHRSRDRKKHVRTVQEYRAGARSVLASLLSVLVILLILSPANIAIAKSPQERVQQSQPEPRLLEPGRIIERAVTGTETHNYQIRLEAGQSAYVSLELNNIRAYMTVFDSTDTLLNRIYSLGYTRLVEPMVLIAEVGGDYRVGVRTFWRGSYSIRLGERHTTTEKDRKRLAAQRTKVEYSFAANPVPPEITIQKLEESIAIYDSIGDSRWEAEALYIAANIIQGEGDFQKALNYRVRAANLWHSIGDAHFEADQLGRIGFIYSNYLGDYQQALEYQKRALIVANAAGSSTADTLHYLGVIYHLLADEQRALDYYRQSIEARKPLQEDTSADNVNGRAVTLNNIANLYRAVGGDEKPLDYFAPRTATDRRKAIEYYNQALTLYQIDIDYAEKSGGEGAQAKILLKIGNTYAELEDYHNALDYLDHSLKLYRDLKFKRGEALVLQSLGNLYARSGQQQKAFEYFEEVLALLHDGVNRENETDYLNSIGVTYSAAGEKQKALELHKESLRLSRERAQEGVAAAALYNIARIERDLGNLNDARSHIEEAIQTVESMRARLAGHELRASYFANIKSYYDFYVDLLMRAHQKDPAAGFDATALLANERGRARTLIELLNQADAKTRRGVDPKLLERETRLRQQLNFKAAQQTHLLLKKHTEAQAQEIAKALNALTDEYENLESQIRTANPRYAALTQPAPINKKEIQQLLDPETILLEYALGNDRSFVWAVTRETVASFELPSRTEIESEAISVYKLLVARNVRPKGETYGERYVRISQAETEYKVASARLSRMLLGPLAKSLGSKRLVVVADGALHYLPFAALPLPGTSKSEDNGWEPLVAKHEVINLPSASVMGLLRSQVIIRNLTSKTVAVIADPVFDRQDARVSRGNDPTQAVNSSRAIPDTTDLLSTTRIESDVERSAGEVGMIDDGISAIPRLSFSRREADSIVALAPAGNVLKAVDFQASFRMATSQRLAQYRIIHFATHGLLNTQHPELSGLILSLVDEHGAPQDGFLRLNEIYNLNLPADLVVLSACNSALGKEVRGEGLVGLIRGFMYAGASRVVASLWKVDDAATAEFMKIFYQKMLKERMAPAAALRATQVEMSAQKRWESPYYWAAFLLQGEWR